MRSFLIYGNLKKRREFVENFVKEEKIQPFNIIHYADDLGIKEARGLRLLLSKKSNGKRLVLIESTMTPDAQNALLKSFEELPHDTAVVLSVEKLDKVLGTVQSRLNVHQLEGNVVREMSDLNISLVSLCDRILFVDNFLNTKSNNPSDEVLSELITTLRVHLLHTKDHDEVLRAARILKDLLKLYPLIVNNNVNIRLGVENIFFGN